ncbi:ribonuclease P protein component [Verrucomicrobiota bacterium]
MTGGLDKPTGPNRKLSRDQRLTRSALFRETYAQNHSWVGRYMVLWVREGEDASLRLGVVSSKRVGGAVQRNRARRRIREAWRRLRPHFSGDVDVVFVCRGYLLRAPWEKVVKEMLWLAEQAGLIAKEDKKAAREAVLEQHQ